jgi:hypothetical protein
MQILHRESRIESDVTLTQKLTYTRHRDTTTIDLMAIDKQEQRFRLQAALIPGYFLGVHT